MVYQRIRIDSISLVSTASGRWLIAFKTPFWARVGGKYKLAWVGYAMQDMINKYFDTNLGKAAPKTKPTYSPQQFAHFTRMVKTPLIAQFVPTVLTALLYNRTFVRREGWRGLWLATYQSSLQYKGYKQR